MGRQPPASVVIDNYNYATYLPEAIDSALGQTYERTEVVVVDDGSTDGSREVIARYGSRVKALLQPNGGQAAAFNAGLGASSGDVVLFLDADDKLLPRAVERAVELFAESGVVNVSWKLWVMDENGRRTGRRYPPHALRQGDFRELVAQQGPHAYLPSPTSGNAWARSFLESVFPIPEHQFERLADAYFLTLAPAAGLIRRLERPHACYRVHGSNSYAGKDWLETFRELYEFYDRRCDALSRYLRREGISHDPAAWKDGNSHYRWVRTLATASERIEQIVPRGERFVLVDEDKWGSSGRVLARTAIPFVEGGGEYVGLPESDGQAVAEAERQRQAGAAFMVFAWPSLWCLDYYPGLASHLRARYTCVADDDTLVAFDLRGGG